MGDMLSPLAPVGEDLSNETHLYGYQVVKVLTDYSAFYLAANPPIPLRCWFLANESQLEEYPQGSVEITLDDSATIRAFEHFIAA
jgi:hypothetical protein